MPGSRPKLVLDACYRLAYRIAYRLLRLSWRFYHPSTNGALVLLWYQRRFLLVRCSYRTHWGLPGGGIHRHETPLEAARRELREEIGLDVPAAALNLVQVAEHLYESRRDRTHLYEVHLTAPPRLIFDQREIIGGTFLTPEDALRRRIPPYLAQYLNQYIAENSVLT